jgi:hypothetical protein
MFDKLKHWFGTSAPARTEPIPQPPESRPAPPKKKEPPKTPKDIATEAGEPYVAIVSMDIDSNNLHQGAFELDWNDIFVARLVKAGYMLKPTDTDADMVDRWFQNVCRHVVMETWEQEQAIKTGFIKERNLGDGRSEVS